MVEFIIVLVGIIAVIAFLAKRGREASEQERLHEPDRMHTGEQETKEHGVSSLTNSLQKKWDETLEVNRALGFSTNQDELIKTMALILKNSAHLDQEDVDKLLAGKDLTNETHVRNVLERAGLLSYRNKLAATADEEAADENDEADPDEDDVETPDDDEEEDEYNSGRRKAHFPEPRSTQNVSTWQVSRIVDSKEAIATAVQRGSSVYVYGVKGNLLFVRGGELQGFSGSTVSIKQGMFTRVYDEMGRLTFSR